MTHPIEITDVTLRDGLQTETVLSTENKLSIFERLLMCGYSRVEVTSFVPPRWSAQSADSEQLCGKIFAGSAPNVQTMAFVPNEKGLDRLLQFPIPWVSAFIAASQSFNKKNVNASIEDTFVMLRKIVHRAHQEKRLVRIYISTVFGCPYEGEIPCDKRLDLLKAVAGLEPDEIALSDTIGVAFPAAVKDILRDFAMCYPKEKTALHLHNTYGLALANASAAYEHGISKFDGSTGGIGGCPYANGATGNVASEELLYLFYRQKWIQTFRYPEIERTLMVLKDLGLNLHSRLFDIAQKGGQKGGSIYGLR